MNNNKGVFWLNIFEKQFAQQKQNPYSRGGAVWLTVGSPYNSRRRTICPVYWPLDRIQTLLMERHWAIVTPAKWAKNMADRHSAATYRPSPLRYGLFTAIVWALHSYPYGTSIAILLSKTNCIKNTR